MKNLVNNKGNFTALPDVMTGLTRKYIYAIVTNIVTKVNNMRNMTLVLINIYVNVTIELY